MTLMLILFHLVSHPSICKMITTKIFLFLLGIQIGHISAIHSDVKYEPNRIAIREQIDQGPFLIPELGPPPYLPNFIHQGSNYFFGMPFPMAPAPAPPLPPIETVITEVRDDRDCNDIAIVANPEITEIVVEKEKPIFVNPIIGVEEAQIFQKSKLSLPIPDISLNLKPIPQLPSFPVVSTQQLVSQLQLPLQSLNIPGLPLLKTPKVPMYIDGAINAPEDFVITEVEVPLKKIPPPPELPPLILEKILKPVIVEDKKVILIPSPPEIEDLLPPSVVVGGQPCQPTLCAQNIVFERVLPNIICENFKNVELISIPAAKRVPVVTAPLLPFMKK